MTTPGERLQEARKRYFETAREAAAALSLSPFTYHQYENGNRQFSRHAPRFAEFFRVDLQWLLTGKGGMRRKGAAIEVPILGAVGAGSTVQPFDDTPSTVEIDRIAFPDPESVAAVICKGDSGYPRFQDGEIIIYYIRPVSPRDVVNTTAIVETGDGRRLIKQPRPQPGTSLFTLESFNAPPEHDVELLSANKIHSIVLP